MNVFEFEVDIFIVSNLHNCFVLFVCLFVCLFVSVYLVSFLVRFALRKLLTMS